MIWNVRISNPGGLTFVSFSHNIQWGGHPQHAAKECSVLPIGTDMVRSCFSEILSLKLRGPDQVPKYPSEIGNGEGWQGKKDQVLMVACASAQFKKLESHCLQIQIGSVMFVWLMQSCRFNSCLFFQLCCTRQMELDQACPSWNFLPIVHTLCCEAVLPKRALLVPDSPLIQAGFKVPA